MPRHIVSLFEAQLQRTFFVTKVERRMYLAIAVVDKDGALAESGSNVREFINKLTDYIQLVDLTRALQKHH